MGRFCAGAVLAASLAGLGCGADTESAGSDPTPDDTSCPAGFDGAGPSCVPVLPATPCPPGQMALLGELTCRPVAPCGGTRWGEAPIEPTTQFVDASYQGGSSDGTEAQPWTRIGDAIAAATPGAVVAIAPGSYAEQLKIDKPVRLWGQCPAKVGIDGSTAATPDTAILVEADGAELHDLAVHGAEHIGVLVSDKSSQVVLSRLWVHDVGNHGVALGPDASMVDSLVESFDGVGVRSGAEQSWLERTVIRGGSEPADGKSSWGVWMFADLEDDVPSRLTVRDCVVEALRGYGIASIKGELLFERSVIRQTMSNGQGLAGDGAVATCAVNTNTDPHTVAACGDLRLVDSWIGDTARAGVATFGARVELSGTMLECNAIHINGETVNIQPEAVDFEIINGLGNRCGCGAEEVVCKVMSAGLEPPSPLGD